VAQKKLDQKTQRGEFGSYRFFYLPGIKYWHERCACRAVNECRDDDFFVRFWLVLDMMMVIDGDV